MARFLIVICFLLAFAAGLTVGIQSPHQAAVQSPPPPERGGWLATELNLTPEQQEQMRKIWSETARRGGRERDEHRRRLYRQRDEEIAALIRPEDRAKYEAVLQNHAERLAALDAEWKSAFEASVARTREILTPQQRVKYDEFLQRHRRDREERGERGEWGDRGPRDRRRGMSGPDHHGGERSQPAPATEP